MPSVPHSPRSKPAAPPCRGSARLHDQLHRACTECALVKHRLTLYRTDAFLVIRGQFIGIEFKTGRSTPNPAQVATHADLRRAGAQVHLIHTIHEFDHLLTHLLSEAAQ